MRHVMYTKTYKIHEALTEQNRNIKSKMDQFYRLDSCVCAGVRYRYYNKTILLIYTIEQYTPFLYHVRGVLHGLRK